MTETTTMKSVGRFDALSDPFHGWLKVPRKMLVDLKIIDAISVSSFQRGEFVYLEEDLDWGIFRDALAAEGKTFTTRERFAESGCRIRSYESFKTTLAERLVRARERAGLSPRQADKLLGYNPGVMESIEARLSAGWTEDVLTRQFREDGHVKVADLYGVTIGWLLKGGNPAGVSLDGIKEAENLDPLGRARLRAHLLSMGAV